MLLNAFNPIDYVQNIMNNKNNLNEKEYKMETTPYKNLKQEEEENISKSNAINFLESNHDNIINVNNTDNSQKDILRKNPSNNIIDKLFVQITNCLKFLSPLLII